jgi:glycosyltransferase A (GT-A) superfamily protein (DUF2064 family)
MSLPRIPYHRCALALMARVPVPAIDESKTGLSPPLTPIEAVALQQRFLRDIAMNIGDICDAGRAEGVAVFTPARAESTLKELVPTGFKLFPQRGEALGEVLSNAIEDLLKRGFPSVCLINCDSPTLPRSFIEVAIESLTRPGDRMVLGPVDGGGSYLIGHKQPPGDLFDRITSSTSDIVVHTTTRAAANGLKVEMLPPWYEVKDAKTLNQLCLDLLGPDRRDRAYPAPFTRQYLAKLIETEGPGRISPGLTRRS